MITTFYKPEGWLLDTPQNQTAIATLEGLQEALDSGRVLEARAAVCTGSHDLLVELGCGMGLIPREEGALGIREGTARDIALLSRVNKPVSFVVTQLRQEPDGRVTPILSRRAAQERCAREQHALLEPGDVLDARVTHMEPFGCFVDIGCGIPSLIPIDCISVSRISHPADRFSQGQDIKAVVLGREAGGRICLTHKELLGSWEENAALFCGGETVAGVVRSVEPYGVFVELTPNLAGLAEPRPGVQPGQQASVYIKSLLPEKMKVKLILVDAFDAVYHPRPLHYFLPPNGHLDRWVYSPACSPKRVETCFLPHTAGLPQP